MNVHDQYRGILLRGQLPPLHSHARRRLLRTLRFTAGLPIWMQSSATPPGDLPDLVQHARELGPSWSW